MAAAIALLSGSMVPGAAEASWFGTTVNYQYYAPDLSSPLGLADNGNKVVGAGVEVSDIAVGLGTMDISANNILVTFAATDTWTAYDFNGWVLTELTPGAALLTGVSIDPTTNISGFSLANVSFTDNSVTVNWGGASFTPGAILSLNLEFAPVPAPAAAPVMAAGLAALGLVLRRRRAAQA